MAENKYLSIYLNDHLAAAVAVVQLARRVAKENADSPDGESLARLSEEIDEDRHTLQNMLKALGGRGDAIKIIAAVGAEKFGRLKLNGELFSYSPLSRVVELEALMIGVAAKQTMWRTLGAALADESAVRAVDFDELVKRATSQRRRLDRLHRRAGEQTF